MTPTSYQRLREIEALQNASTHKPATEQKNETQLTTEQTPSLAAESTTPTKPSLPADGTTPKNDLFDLQRFRQHTPSEMIGEKRWVRYFLKPKAEGGTAKVPLGNHRWGKEGHGSNQIRQHDRGSTMSNSNRRVVAKKLKDAIMQATDPNVIAQLASALAKYLPKPKQTRRRRNTPSPIKTKEPGLDELVATMEKKRRGQVLSAEELKMVDALERKNEERAALNGGSTEVA